MLNIKLMILILLSILLASNSVQAQTNFIDKQLEKKLVNICEALKSDSKIKLRRAIKDSRLKEQNVMKGLVCNGMDPITFALSENANVTAQYAAAKSGVDYTTIAQRQTLSKGKQTLTQE
ncbi:MAG: hypothetical protein ACI97K_001348 [Glaciecola sp.]|jgi:hypothetical protein